MKSLPGLDAFGTIIFAIKWWRADKYLTLMLSTLGKTLLCPQPLPEHREKATELHTCLCKSSLIPTMVRDQGPSATSSDLWSAGKTSSKTPSCCPSSTPGIEEDKISVSSLSTLLYEAMLVWNPSCGAQLSTRGLQWSRVLWQGAGRCCYPWVGAVLQVQWRHLLPPEPLQSPGFQPGGFGQLCFRLHLSHHPVPHHPLHPPPRPPAFPLPSATLQLPPCPSSHPCLHSSCLLCLPPTTASHRPCLSADGPGQSLTALHGALAPSRHRGPFSSCSLWGDLQLLGAPWALEQS